jgi:glucosamine--fructose-6-phosphate aminotransferase (isomerizing)
MSRLEAMIRRQPEELQRLAQLDVAAHADRLRGCRRVIMAGTGTSQHAAELGALMLYDAGVDALACPAAAFGRGAIPLRDGDGVVVISHTAETSYARRSRDLAQQADAPLVSVTGRIGAWPEAIETVSREESETYTVSYTATLAVLTLLAEELGSTTYTRRALAATVTKVERALLREVTVPMPARALAITGAGPWGVTAREGALKLREAARMLAEGFDAEYLLHGSAVPLGPADGLVLLEPDADRDGLVTALGEAAAAERIPVSTLTLDTDLPPVLAQIPMTVVLQRLAASWARLRAQDPDVAIVGAWAEPTLWELGS